MQLCVYYRMISPETRHLPTPLSWRGLALLLALQLLATLFPGRALPAEAVMLQDAHSYSLAGHLSVLEDSTRELTLEQVLATHGESAFTPLEGHLNKGYRRAAYWVEFTLLRTSQFPAAGWLRLTPSYTDELTIFIQRPGSDPDDPAAYSRYHLGDRVPVAERPVKSPDFVVPVMLPEGEPVRVLARIHSMSSISLAGELHTWQDLQEHTINDLIVQSSYLGIGLVICLMNFIFYLSIREKLFLYFSLYALTVVLNSLAVEGMISMLLPAYSHYLTFYFVRVGIGAQVLVFSFFAMTLFRATANPWSIRILVVMAAMGMLTMLSVPMGFYPVIMPVTFLSTMLLILILLWESTRMLSDFPQTAIFMFLAFAISTGGYVYQIVKLMGFIPLGPTWDLNTIQPATLIHMVLISLALSERLRFLERQVGESFMLAEKRATEIATEMTRELVDNKERLEVSLAAEHLSAERQHRFLTMVSHEYRTPLAIIQGNLDLIEAKNEESGKTPLPELEKMRKAVKRLVDVMDVSLEQSRIMDPQVMPRLSRVGANEFVASQVEAARWMWGERCFTLTSFLSDEELAVDLPLLNTALFNLLENAQKYADPESRIEVEARSVGQRVQIKITNEFSGTMDDDTEHLFEKYARGAGNQTAPGAGIGLWLVRQILRQHGGEVSIRRNGRGRVTSMMEIPVGAPPMVNQDLSENMD